MLDQVLATFTEGAVFYLGVPLLHKLCRILGSVSKGKLLTIVIEGFLREKHRRIITEEAYTFYFHSHGD